ncbi:MAG: hypothetical protein M1835_007268 [Candelina submexicana]|nr:MAG: hypothetical protein M1835_007268 [Candelina submexicana]
MHLPRIPVFLIFYSTTFTVLSLVLLVLLLITPGDAVRQALKNKQLYNVFIIPSVYLLTLIVTVLVFSSRLFTNRSVLAGIPKTYIPIDQGDVSKSVRRMIVDGLARSRRIACDARPRDLQRQQTPNAALSKPTRPSSRGSRTGSNRRLDRSNESLASVKATQTYAPWGIIAHRGWSSPASADLPNLQYTTIVSELPHLIEAKAVSLAPPDAALPIPSIVESDTIIPPDARAVALLQRSATMGLRDYLSYLTTLNLIRPPSLGLEFLAQYEKARFSTVPSTEEEFRALMRSFAEILRGMTHLDEDILSTLLAELDTSISDGASSLSHSSLTTEDDTLPGPPQNTVPTRLRSNSTDAVRTPSSSHQRQSTHSSQDKSHQPSTPRLGLRIPSAASLRAPRPSYVRSSPSSASRASQSSVIRLSEGLGDGELPYTINSAPA